MELFFFPLALGWFSLSADITFWVVGMVLFDQVSWLFILLSSRVTNDTPSYSLSWSGFYFLELQTFVLFDPNLTENLVYQFPLIYGEVESVRYFIACEY